MSFVFKFLKNKALFNQKYRDKDLFLNYCQNVEDLIQQVLCNQQELLDFTNILNIVKKISNLSFSENSNLKLSPESLACKVIKKKTFFLLKIK